MYKCTKSNSFPAKDDVSKLLKASGVEPEADKLDLLIKNLEGKQLHELIAAGSSKIVSVGAAPAGGAAAAGGDANDKPEEVKEEKVEETENVDMGGLFDDDDDDY